MKTKYRLPTPTAPTESSKLAQLHPWEIMADPTGDHPTATARLLCKRGGGGNACGYDVTVRCSTLHTLSTCSTVVAGWARFGGVDGFIGVLTTGRTTAPDSNIPRAQVSLQTKHGDVQLSATASSSARLLACHDSWMKRQAAADHHPHTYLAILLLCTPYVAAAASPAPRHVHGPLPCAMYIHRNGYSPVPSVQHTMDFFCCHTL